MSIFADVREVVASRELLVNFVRRELRSKYKGTALGWAWSLINPLATTAIFTVVFSTIMRVDPPVGVDGLHNYPLFLLCGLLTWNFMAGSVQSAQGVLIANGNLIKKTYFPRRLLVIATILAALVSYAIEMVVLAALFLVAGVNVLPWIPLVAVVMTIVACFSLGLGLMLSVVNVYFRDMAHFIALFMQVWFYVTPIIYPITLVSQIENGPGWASGLPLVRIFQANPMTGFVESIRDMLYSGHAPSWALLAYCLAVSLVAVWLGNLVFGRLERRLAEEL